MNRLYRKGDSIRLLVRTMAGWIGTGIIVEVDGSIVTIEKDGKKGPGRCATAMIDEVKPLEWEAS